MDDVLSRSQILRMPSNRPATLLSLPPSLRLTVDEPIVVGTNSTTFLSDTSSTFGQMSVAVAGTLTSDPEEGVTT